MPAELHQLRVLGDPEASCLAAVPGYHKFPGRARRFDVILYE